MSEVKRPHGSRFRDALVPASRKSPESMGPTPFRRRFRDTHTVTRTNPVRYMFVLLRSRPAGYPQPANISGCNSLTYSDLLTTS